MSRTAHHIRSRRGPAPDAALGDELVHAALVHTVLVHTVLVRDLRFSVRCLAEASRAGRRSRPQTLRRRVTVRRLPRCLRDSSVAVMAAQAERRARQRLRADLRSVLLLGRAEDADVLPARHRHGALWLA
ncbi:MULTISPECIES: hypothetical protein [unclassified Streptomyces]|uniref:hypothetical protein n=1 Tax=unclassified Streptomyces TaxID=2593676 RepID=UPI0004C839BB|nr:hypothetical protein [Streptomyces sp. NRRL F-2747]